MATINDILDKIRKGEIKGKVELEIDNKGKINKVIVAQDTDNTEKRYHKEIDEVNESIEKISLKADEVKGADFSNTSISGNLSGLDLSDSDFSYARIEKADMSGSNFSGASFDKTTLSQTDLQDSYSVDMRKAYLTGSVNLYGAKDAPSVQDVYKTANDVPRSYKGYSYGKELHGKGKPDRYGNYNNY